MALDYFSVGISLVILIIDLVIFFVLFQVNLRSLGRLTSSIIYFRAVVLLLLIRRVEIIFIQLDMLNLFYLEDITSLVLAIVLLLAFMEFYKAVLEATGKMRNVSKPQKKQMPTKKGVVQQPQRRFKPMFSSRMTDDNYLDLTK